MNRNVVPARENSKRPKDDGNVLWGQSPAKLTAELPKGDDFPVGNVKFTEAEAFCRKLAELGRQSFELPKNWEFRLPTEAQWEYAGLVGTTTATAFGDKLRFLFLLRIKVPETAALARS
jgi:formylglycine-generating enzyme required for sulfatase activity